MPAANQVASVVTSMPPNRTPSSELKKASSEPKMASMGVPFPFPVDDDHIFAAGQ